MVCAFAFFNKPSVVSFLFCNLSLSDLLIAVATAAFTNPDTACMNDTGVSFCFSGSAVSAGVGGTVNFGVLVDPTEAVVCFSKDGLVEIGGLVGRLASRGSRGDAAFGLSMYIPSDMMHSWTAGKPCTSLYSSHRNNGNPLQQGKLGGGKDPRR